MRSLTEIILLFFVSTSVLLGTHVSAAPSQPGYLAKRQDQKLQAVAELVSQNVNTVTSTINNAIFNNAFDGSLKIIQGNVIDIVGIIENPDPREGTNQLCTDLSNRLSGLLSSAMNINNSLMLTEDALDTASTAISSIQNTLNTVGISIVSTAPPTTTLVAREVSATSVPKPSLPIDRSGSRQLRKRDSDNNPLCPPPLDLTSDDFAALDDRVIFKGLVGGTGQALDNILNFLSQTSDEAESLLQSVQAGDDNGTRTQLSNLLTSLANAQSAQANGFDLARGFLATLRSGRLLPA